MNDYEINLRLGEIAGHSIGFDCGWSYFVDEFSVIRQWNPLHDWSQLGPLMEREDITVGLGEDGQWQALCFDPRDMSADAACSVVTRPDIKEAIALAIIAAHDEEDKE